MKAVLGLTAITLFSVSCSADGDALFDDIAGRSAGAAAGSGASSGSPNGNGGGTGESGTSQGGNAQSGGASGSNGNGGSSGGGRAGEGGSSGSSSGAGDGGNSASGEAGVGGMSEDGDGGAGGAPITDPQVIYVASTGTDSEACGLEPSNACQTISRGVSRGVTESRDTVYVQAGSYPGVVALASGVHVLGGFDEHWVSGAYTQPEHRVVVEGGSESTSHEYLAVWAHNLAATASLENLVIAPPPAEGQRAGGLDGRSSYGVHAVSAKLSLKDVAINAADGAPGGDGENGLDAENTSVVDAMNGSSGIDGALATASGMGGVPACNITTSSGGPGGTNVCGLSP